jgi:hypothetical protein
MAKESDSPLDAATGANPVVEVDKASDHDSTYGDDM